MARLLGDRPTSELSSYIRDSPRRPGEGIAVLLLSVDDSGWPHVAVISL